nr:probable carbohydrate esterase At4g34215 [Ipomoea batatas]
MAGRGNMHKNERNETVWDGVTPNECLSNPSILRLAFNKSWVLAKEPLHADIDVTKARVCGVGPGMAFANQLLKSDTAVGIISLVPCAIGGTTLNEWLPAAKAYYNEMLIRTYAALRASDGGQLRALLWFQGESDAMELEYKRLYWVILPQSKTDSLADVILILNETFHGDEEEARKSIVAVGPAFSSELTVPEVIRLADNPKVLHIEQLAG